MLMGDDEGNGASREVLRLLYRYAHQDEHLRAQLEKHLGQLRNEKKIIEWHRGAILGGSEIAAQTEQELKAADIILLLITSNFLNSGTEEMKLAIDRQSQGVVVIPIV